MSSDDWMRSIKIVVESILEGEAYKEIKRMWKFCEREYDSKAVQNFPHPHLSFQGGICDDIKKIDANLENLSTRIKPYLLRMGGINSFEKLERVIFLEVEKTKTLQLIHQKIDDLLRKHCAHTFELCSPQNWHPHVTLAHQDLTVDNFQKAKKELQNYHLRYKLRVHNVCLVRWYDNDRKIRIYKKYALE